MIDSDTKKKAVKRNTFLAILASLYLPATLAVGIFGMNISQITNDQSQPGWTTAAHTFLGLTGVSVLFIAFVFLNGFEKIKNVNFNVFGPKDKTAEKDHED